MASDLSIYKVGLGELLSSSKQNNLIQRLQDTLNAIGDLTVMQWAPGQIVDPAQLKQIGATVGQVMTWTGAAWAPQAAAVAPGPIVYRKSTPKVVNTSTAPTDLLNGEITIAAGALGTNKLLRLTAILEHLQNTGSDASPPRFQLRLGGTTLLDTGGGITNCEATAAARRGFVLSATVQAKGAANAQVSALEYTILAVAGAPAAAVTTFAIGNGSYRCNYAGAGNGTLIAAGTNTTAVDTSAACLLELTLTNGNAGAQYETALLAATVEVI